MNPIDYENPDWDNAGRIHDWRNYVSEDLQSIWDTFDGYQKKAIAENADRLAEKEEWD